MCSVCLLMVLNICVKFHENMSSGFKVIQHTRKLLTHKGQLLKKKETQSVFLCILHVVLCGLKFV